VKRNNPCTNPMTPARRTAVGSRVRRERLNAGWTQRQLATAAGVSQSLISMTEQGRWTPSPETVDRILGAMGAA